MKNFILTLTLLTSCFVTVYSQSLTISITKNENPPEESTVQGMVRVKINLTNKKFERTVTIGSESDTKTAIISNVQTKDAGYQNIIVVDGISLDGVVFQVVCFYGSSDFEDTYMELFGKGSDKDFVSIEYEGSGVVVQIVN